MGSGLLIPRRIGAGFVLVALTALPAAADRLPGVSLRAGSGLIEMPSALPQPDGQINVSVSHAGGVLRNAVSFQITPRLQGSFRYSGFRLPANAAGIAGGYGPGAEYFDRAFDLSYLLVAEGGGWPAIAVGLRDFAGTGMDGAEYIVASRRLTPRLSVTAGLGWGQMGSRDPLFSTGDRSAQRAAATGGTPNFRQWFRGPAAPFAGVEWQATPRLGLKAEWSSDAYRELSGAQRLFPNRSPLNFGAEYQLTDAVKLGGYALYGSRIGMSLQIALNPRLRPAAGLRGAAPLPLSHRPSRTTDPAAWSDAWTQQGSESAVQAIGAQVRQAMASEGLRAEAIAVSGPVIRVRMRNLRYHSAGQALGRAGRALSRSLPSSVEYFDIVPVERGMDLSVIRISRSDLEALEHQPDQADLLWQRSRLSEAASGAPAMTEFAPAPRLTWDLAPFLRYSLFDPDSPLRFDTGLRLRGEWQIARGLTLAGAIEQRLAGTMGQQARPSNSVLPHVRTDDYLRSRRDTRLASLYLASYARPGRHLYSRVTAGYLERGYAGLSGELLWKPVGSRLALGAELHHVRQRSLSGFAGLGDYGVTGGHLSVYYEFPKGYLAQLDMGRYLAGDYGATLSLEREFAGGWRVGAFATLTNVSRQAFGEGSFDKGIRFTLPLNWVTGLPSRKKISNTVRMLQRDGGARLEIPGPLYETLRGWHGERLQRERGLLWR
ncbi:YjbH domain-containing protein [Falsigemmobacter faecalis]|nr:YjbH domain-containing protein [Falsigemmobacter faecalis]